MAVTPGRRAPAARSSRSMQSTSPPIVAVAGPLARAAQSSPRTMVAPPGRRRLALCGPNFAASNSPPMDSVAGRSVRQWWPPAMAVQAGLCRKRQGRLALRYPCHRRWPSWLGGRLGRAILATADGGATWIRQASDTRITLLSVDVAADGRNGWAVGQDGTIVKLSRENLAPYLTSFEVATSADGLVSLAFVAIDAEADPVTVEKIEVCSIEMAMSRCTAIPNGSLAINEDGSYVLAWQPQTAGEHLVSSRRSSEISRHPVRRHRVPVRPCNQCVDLSSIACGCKSA